MNDSGLERRSRVPVPWSTDIGSRITLYRLCTRCITKSRRLTATMKRKVVFLTSFPLLLLVLWFFYDFQREVAPVKAVGAQVPLLNVDVYTRPCYSRAKIVSALETQLQHIRRKSSVDCLVDKIMHVPELPVIYVITPTFTRPVQKAELTRLSQAFMLVPNLHWIIVEDSSKKSELVKNLLEKTGLSHTHISIATPKDWKLTGKDPHWSKPRGVIQRNAALEWLRNNVTPEVEGVLYFADDDNTYALELFEEMRYVKTVGVWPVGLVGGVKVERPKVDTNGKVRGWLTLWAPKRPFAIDMAGFAVNLQRFLSRPQGKFSFEADKGYQESEFLKHFVDNLDEVEPKAALCTKVYVWHTRTEDPNLTQEKGLAKLKKAPTDAGIEV